MKQRFNMQRNRKRKLLWAEQAGRCAYCRIELTNRKGGQPVRSTDVTFDHVLPRAQGGTARRPNVVLACHDCNQAKAAGSDYRPWAGKARATDASGDSVARPPKEG